MPTPWYDSSIYPRADIHFDVVEAYAELMRQFGWGKFPPIKVGETTGAIYDGVHRFLAAEKAGIAAVCEVIPDPAFPISRLLVGASYNTQHGLPMRPDEKKRLVWKACEADFWDLNTLVAALNTLPEYIKGWQRDWKDRKANEELDAAREAGEAKGKKEVEVQWKGEAYFSGDYAPDTPSHKVLYKKQNNGAVIDYNSVVVEGQEVGDLVVDLRRMLRRVIWAKEAAIYRMLNSSDISLFDEAGLILQRAAMMRKSGSAPVTV